MTIAPRLVVFDCDGTLIDSQHMIVAAMAHAFTAHGLAELPRARVLSIVGLSLDEAVLALLPQTEEPVRRAVTAAAGIEVQSHHAFATVPWARFARQCVGIRPAPA